MMYVQKEKRPLSFHLDAMAEVGQQMLPQFIVSNGYKMKRNRFRLTQSFRKLRLLYYEEQLMNRPCKKWWVLWSIFGYIHDIYIHGPHHYVI